MSAENYEQYASGTHSVLRVYLENNGKYMCLNTDNTLSMVDRENATQFYLNQHVYIADMKVNYELIPSLKASYDKSYKAYSEISKGKVCLLISNSQDHQDCSTYKLIFTEHLNKHATLES